MWLLTSRGDGAPTAAQVLSTSIILLAGFLLRYINRGYQIRKKFQSLKAQGICTKCPPVVYLDTWPLANPLIVSLSADVSSQFMQQHSMPRFRDAKDFFYPLTKNRDIVSMGEAEWEIWRKRLNVGFGAQYITSRIPDIVEEVEEFVNILKSRAGSGKTWGPVFLLEHATRNLTLDISVRFFFTIPRKTLIDLIVQALEEEAAEEQGSSRKKPQDLIGLANDSLEVVVGQLNVFMLAGFETTGSAISWVFRLLCQHPTVLARLRQEHDEILGPDPWGAADALKENPQLVNMLTYTHAVVRESMRVHTNVGTIRHGDPGFFLTGPPGSGPGFEGKKLPADDFGLWDGVSAIHRDPEIWHRANEFVPERFLVTDTNDPLCPPPNAWRAFAAGPRNCIGQHLALVEIKLVMAVAARCFDIDCTWDEWDRSRQTGPPTVWGDRYYQVGRYGPPRVKEGMPVHVRVRSQV
ncbi:cytochrome P450 [Fusarium solani]|uniref:Cytochrome P450 n=1 Tax=Fusarium solani TaxID=169388 RepID=A0A9P9KKL0_FUSSL|nr:cytochrome P450 [Fusarium solani]KAH7260580.1 cytochrome P450 [Fusarium solani]